MMKSHVVSQALPNLINNCPLGTFACWFSLAFLAVPTLGWAQDQNDPQPFPDTTQQAPLNEAELIAAFSDKTHLGSYNFNRPNIETFSFEERTTSDGRTIHAQGDRIDRGTWRVKANVICFHYYEWQPGVDHCFNIYKRGNCFYHYGLSFYWRGGGQFTARTVHKGEAPDCEPAFV